jgi:Tol biopolymer transport system component
MSRVTTVFVAAVFLQLACDKREPLGKHLQPGPAGPFRFSTPSLSLDGRIIAYDTDSTGLGDIYLYDRGGTSAVPIVQSPVVETSPILSSDGSKTAFARKTNGHQHIWILNTRAGHSSQRQITQGNVLDSPIRFSTNDANLYFVRRSVQPLRSLEDKELFVARVTAEGPVQILPLGQFSIITADGRIAVKEKYDRALGCNQLFRVNRNSGREEHIGCGYLPSISDDGESVTYITADARYLQHIVLWRLDRDTEVLKNIPVGNKSRADFCLGDKAIVFRVLDSERDGPGGAYLLHFDNRKIEKLEGIEGGRFIH